MNSYIALYGLMTFACWFVKKIQIPSMNFLNKIVNIPIKYNLMIEVLNKHGETISAKMYPDDMQILDYYGNVVPETSENTTLPSSNDTSSEESSEKSSEESSEKSSEDEVKDTTEEQPKDEVKNANLKTTEQILMDENLD